MGNHDQIDETIQKKELREKFKSAIRKALQASGKVISENEEISISRNVLEHSMDVSIEKQKQVKSTIIVDSEEVSSTIYMITFASHEKVAEAASYNIKNLTTDWNRLCLLGSTGILAGIAVAAVPWTAPFAACIFMNELQELTKVELTENDSVTIYAIWQNKDDHDCVAKASLLGHVNSLLDEHGRPQISPKQLDDSIDNLKEVKAIESANGQSLRWKLIESVIVESDYKTTN